MMVDLDAFWPAVGTERTVFGDDDDNLITGTTLAERIAALGGDDTVRGGDGDDLLEGGGGDDVLDGDDGDDMLFGGRFARREDGEIDGGIDAEGDDVLRGGAGDDQLHGQGGDDVLQGGDGDDGLAGGDGDDVLDGGPGSDVLLGGDGVDRFEFTAFDPAGGGLDVIADYEAGEIIRIAAGGAPVRTVAYPFGGTLVWVDRGGDSPLFPGDGDDLVLVAGITDPADLSLEMLA
jgi:Ca2+-binding RTX toxin-like protein